ncbi:MAG: hypothetical protein JOY71_22310 [Acetobacteraceae bacterium]|nr:hypothetical protein [Acetobacteraceae bacterium]
MADTAGAWPWLAIVGLGLFHGLNPAMGWLFAVALGLHRQSCRALLLALPPTALGHLLAIWPVAASVLALRVVVAANTLRLAAGGVLAGWALYHWLYGHRRRVRVGMKTGFAGLVLWSFLMANGHGAGLMLAPALMPLCGTAMAGRSWLIGLLAIGTHALATLAATGLVALAVYYWVGLGVLRRGWINFDLLWSGALGAVALLLIVSCA